MDYKFCPKCGNEFKNVSNGLLSNKGFIGPILYLGKLRFSCTQCGFSWKELTLDRKKKKEQREEKIEEYIKKLYNMVKK